jgi:putative intracellular protease/amidase
VTAKSKSGDSILKGSTATGFSNAEEDQTPYTYRPTDDGTQPSLPFSLQDRVQELGATYVKAEEPWGVKVVWSGGILTGELTRLNGY